MLCIHMIRHHTLFDTYPVDLLDTHVLSVCLSMCAGRCYRMQTSTTVAHSFHSMTSMALQLEESLVFGSHKPASSVMQSVHLCSHAVSHCLYLSQAVHNALQNGDTELAKNLIATLDPTKGTINTSHLDWKNDVSRTDTYIHAHTDTAQCTSVISRTYLVARKTPNLFPLHI